MARFKLSPLCHNRRRLVMLILCLSSIALLRMILLSPTTPVLDSSRYATCIHSVMSSPVNDHLALEACQELDLVNILSRLEIVHSQIKQLAGKGKENGYNKDIEQHESDTQLDGDKNNNIGVLKQFEEDQLQRMLLRSVSKCDTYRTIHGSKEEELTFLEIITACGGNAPVLVSLQIDNIPDENKQESNKDSSNAIDKIPILNSDNKKRILEEKHQESNKDSSNNINIIPIINYHNNNINTAISNGDTPSNNKTPTEKNTNSTSPFQPAASPASPDASPASPVASTASPTRRVIPNVVHYVWFGKSLEISFLNYLSLLSVHKFIQPDYIFIHGDSVPSGRWWRKALAIIPNMYTVRREMVRLINGRKPFHMQHRADVARLQILLDYGGIYLDWDVLVLRSFVPLLTYDVTLGRETGNSLANGIILARRGAAFLHVWLETYHSFHEREWGAHSCLMPNKLAQLLPHLVHVEEKSLVRPSWKETDLLFKGHYPWRENNYAMHVWKRRGHVPENSAQVKTLNSTLGEIMTHVLYS